MNDQFSFTDAMNKLDALSAVTHAVSLTDGPAVLEKIIVIDQIHAVIVLRRDDKYLALHQPIASWYLDGEYRASEGETWMPDNGTEIAFAIPGDDSLRLRRLSDVAGDIYYTAEYTNPARRRMSPRTDQLALMTCMFDKGTVVSRLEVEPVSYQLHERYTQQFCDQFLGALKELETAAKMSSIPSDSPLCGSLRKMLRDCHGYLNHSLPHAAGDPVINLSWPLVHQLHREVLLAGEYLSFYDGLDVESTEELDHRATSFRMFWEAVFGTMYTGTALDARPEAPHVN